MSLCCWSTKRRSPASWTELLNQRGKELWSLRNKILCTEVTRLCVSPQRTHQHVCIFGSAQAFESVESEKGLNKFPPSGTRRPLTQCVGDEWTKSRKMIQLAFKDILWKSLEAAKSVAVPPLIGEFDLKAYVLELSTAWITHLFRGQQDETMQQAVFNHWKATRDVDKKQTLIEETRVSLVESMCWEGGILRSLRDAGFDELRASDNAVNAMIAALDAVQALLFWTLWNLSHTDDAWMEAKTCVSVMEEQNDYDQLIQFKRDATQGKQVNAMSLSYIGRALVETVRVFPPVWTLPRNWYNEEAIASKVDVLTVNGVSAPEDWNPSNPKQSTIASFGLGHRHCPAGTAALFAAHHFLCKIVSSLEGNKTLVEKQPGKALDFACLVPTLSTLGTQTFCVTSSSFK